MCIRSLARPISIEFWSPIGSGHQDQQFFGEMVEDCQRIRMKAGETLFIPSGWIHAVYSPMDCINFGGNFLHGLSMAMQVN